MSSKDTRTRRLVTVKEALTYGRLGHTKLYEKIGEGVIKAYRRDGQTLVDLNSIDDWNESLPPLVLKSAGIDAGTGRPSTAAKPPGT